MKRTNLNLDDGWRVVLQDVLAGAVMGSWIVMLALLLAKEWG